MDRSIDPATRTKRTIRRLVGPVGVAAVAMAVVTVAIQWLQPSIRRDRMRTAIVERGDVVSTLDASGLVVPGFEQILAAPISTHVIRVLKTPGSEVQPGETIVMLDDTDARRDVARLEEQIALQRNTRRQTELNLERLRNDLITSRQVKSLELESYRFELRRNRTMFDQGLTHEDAVRQSETDVARARIELSHVEAQLAIAEEDLEARVEGLVLEIASLEKELELARERLGRTRVSSDWTGVVTWVLANEGAAAAEGEPVARVADVSTYRVEATLSDVLARRLTEGLPAIVRSGDMRMGGRVHKVFPAVENGVVTFEVHLDEPDQGILRPNLRVDVHAVIEQRVGALRLRRGPLLNVDGRDAVFVVRGERAVRTPVTVGLANFETYEITGGLAEGEEVIISDMSEYRKDKEVKIR